MKTIGLIGGMSWESSLEYYRLINEMVKKRLGGFHSAKIILSSVDFDEIEKMQRAGQWEQAGTVLAENASGLEKAGADFVLLCTNTMHKCAPAITSRINVPFIHIASPAGKAVRQMGFTRIGLLGTRFTMEEDFYSGKLLAEFGIHTIIPDAPERETIHRVIFDELCLGVISDASRLEFVKIIRDLQSKGAQGIVLGCTEIGLLVHPGDSPLPLFDTTLLHAETAVDLALST